MNCPACRSSLQERHVSDVKIDVCEEGCAGIWFDGSQIKKMDEPQDPDAETILNLKPATDVTLQAEPHNCPKCRTNTLTRIESAKSGKKKILLEDCSKCRGVFINASVLNVLRRENPTETSRKLAAAKLFEETFLKSKLDKEEATRLKRYAEAVKFLCPSFYLSAEIDRDAF
jgi:uncharacterized protein